MNVSITRLAFAALLALMAKFDCAAAERRWDAQAIYSQAVTSDVRLTSNGDALELERGDLIEDDGPAAGYSYRPNEESLTDATWIKKQLLVDDPRSDRALLLVGAKGSLQFVINNSTRQLRPIGNVGSYWQSFELPADVLKAGLNEVVIHGSGSIWIARDDEFAVGSRTRTSHPNRSAKSDDGGRTWNDKQLGTIGNLDGEYYVRLFLDRFQSEGSLLMPVVDLGQPDGEIIGQPLSSVGPVRVRLQTHIEADGSVAVRVRSGKTPDPAAKDWTDWQQLGTDGVVEKPAGRYVQLAVTLKTSNPLASPRLKEVVVSSESTRSSDWVDDLKIVESHNEEIVRSSIPFEYEPFDHPRLKEFRERYRLDEVAAGASDEFELIKRLAAWSATRWAKLGHLGEAYPPWDALEILKPHRDGKSVGGFCQQYNVVFLQACECFGLVGRPVSLGPGDLANKIRGGHEVVEIWSNEFKKWIYVDGNYAWYLADAESDVPLSLWELRQRQLAAFREEPYQPVRLERIVDTGEPWTDLKGKPPFAELRLIPRSNFLEAQAPLPLNQGMRGWFWTGHYVWTDEKLPASSLYANRVGNRRNWEWTLNQARYTLEATEVPGMIRVHLQTETPHFETYLAAIDGVEKAPAQSGFLWKLRPGINRLEIRPRNSAGRDGIASWVVLGYHK